MKKLLIAGLVALALGTAGCSGCALVGPPPAQSTLMDEKALTVVIAGAWAVDIAAGAAVDNGLLVPGSPQALRIATASRDIHSVVQAAQAAHALGNTEDYLLKLSSAQALIAGAWSMIPKKEIAK